MAADNEMDVPMVIQEAIRAISEQYGDDVTVSIQENSGAQIVLAARHKVHQITGDNVCLALFSRINLNQGGYVGERLRTFYECLEALAKRER
jgi:hypothetical protein